MLMKRSRSEMNLSVKQSRKERRNNEKDNSKDNRSKMNSLVKSLETSLYESQKNTLKIKERTVKHKKIDEAKKENKQLLNVLQQQCNNHDLSRSDISPSYSTVSMVHLQYKYEELLSSHEGLLKLLEAKVREVRKCYMENEKLHNEIKTLKFHADEVDKCVNNMCQKYLRMKQRKDRRLEKIKFERDTIKVAHDKLVQLLHQKCMEQDDMLYNDLYLSADSNKCLLINEIRRANKLQYQNAIQTQENDYLRAKLSLVNLNRDHKRIKNKQ